MNQSTRRTHSMYCSLVCGILSLTACSLLATPAAAAGRWRNRSAAQSNTVQSNTAQPRAFQSGTVQSNTAPGPTGLGNGFNSGNSGSGWNRNNSWYNIPQYGNYAPPPYATSKKAFIQVGPMPAFGGVRSLQGWGGAR